MPHLRERIGLGVFGLLALGVVLDAQRAPEDQWGVTAHGVAISGYRTLVKPMLIGNTHCKFKITCSEYSLRAVRKYGWPKGGLLTIKRLASCA